MKMDRNYHWAGKFEDNEERIKEYWQNTTVQERLEAANYLNSIVYGYDVNNPPKMDRTVFSMKKRD
jgi:hypothetical protein